MMCGMKFVWGQSQRRKMISVAQLLPTQDATWALTHSQSLNIISGAGYTHPVPESEDDFGGRIAPDKLHLRVEGRV